LLGEPSDSSDSWQHVVMSARRVPVNAASLLIGRLVSAASMLLIVRTAAHQLDQKTFGVMVSVMAAGFLANLLVSFGTDTVVTRAVAADRPNAGGLVRSSLDVQIVAAVALIVTAAAAVFLGVDVAVLVQALALIPMAVVTITGAVLRGRQQMDRLLVASAGGAVAALAAVFVGFSVLGAAAWVPIAAVAIGSVVTAAVSAWFVGPQVLHGTRQPVMPLLRETAPFAAMVVLAAVGAQAGVLLVEFFTNETAGGYGVAVRLAEAARLIPAAVMGAFFPAMLTGAHRTERYRPINRIVFNEQPGGTALIRILSLGLVFTVARLALSFELIADGNERIVLRSALVGAVVTVAGGLLAAVMFGSAGVGWAQLCGLVCAVAVLGWNRVTS